VTESLIYLLLGVLEDDIEDFDVGDCFQLLFYTRFVLTVSLEVLEVLPVSYLVKLEFFVLLSDFLLVSCVFV
jgi:hypothetical protein